MTLYVELDGAWMSLNENDDFEGTLGGDGTYCSQLIVSLPAGNYQVRIIGYDFEALDSYFLRFNLTGVCGDGEVGQGGMDDGNNEDGDGCSAACLNESPCGNGRPDVGETCDDSNILNGDGCSMFCQTETTDVVYAMSSETGAIAGLDAQSNGGQNVYYVTADGPAYLTAFTSRADDCVLGDTVIDVYAVDVNGTLGATPLASNDDEDGDAGLYCSLVDAVSLDGGMPLW